MTHTKGPWKMYPVRYNRIAIVTDNGCLRIAEVLNDPDGSMLEATMADARLISAAPDMIEAIELMLSMYDTSDDLDLSDEGKEARDKLLLSYKKATGKNYQIKEEPHPPFRCRCAFVPVEEKEEKESRLDELERQGKHMLSLLADMRKANTKEGREDA